MASNTEEIKERLPITEVVGSYLKLEKAGKNWRARCPFHNEKTPSFFISPDRGSFYCFGCGAGGDIFTFVERFEGVEFRDALRMLAERAGVRLVREELGADRKKERLHLLLEEAAQFYRAQFAKTPDAKTYLVARGLSEASIQEWGVGFAPNEWRALLEHLRSKGFTDAEMEMAGLASRSDKDAGRLYDRFRGRIMFPLFDTAGKPVAFSGRIMPGADTDTPKYVNSPETPLYHKSKLLYGYDRAKFSIRKADFSILVEGQMDLLMSHQAGFRNTVALSGTALSAEQVSALKRLSGNLLIALDADKAGIASALRSAEAALREGMDVKIAVLPPGSDPADLIQKDKEAWRGAIRSSKHVIEFLLEVIAREEPDLRKRRLRAGRTVVPFLRLIESKIDQEHFVGVVARALGVPEESIREELSKLERVSRDAPSAPALGKRTQGTLRKDIIAVRLAGILLWQERLSPQQINIEETRARLRSIMGEKEFERMFEAAKSEEEKLLFEAERFYDASSLAIDVEDLVKNLSEEYLRSSYEEALDALRVAEAAHDETKMAELLSRCRELARALSEGGA